MIGDFESKYIKASDGGRLFTAEMHQARELLIAYLYKLAMYVDKVAMYDEAIILSSGFDISKKRGPKSKFEFIVKPNGHEGSVKLKHKTSRKIISWVWQYCADPISQIGWVNAGVSAQSSFVITGLKPGTKYWFRASHLTREGQSEWCMPYPLMVVYKILKLF